jgi:hypothetical protein
MARRARDDFHHERLFARDAMDDGDFRQCRHVCIKAVVIDVGARIDAYECDQSEAEFRQIEHRAVTENVTALLEAFDAFVNGRPLEADERAELG